MPKEGKNLFQSLGIAGKPMFGGSPEGVDPMSFQGIMGNPMMRFGMGLLKRSGDGQGFGSNVAGAFGDVADGQDMDEARAFRRQQMDYMRRSNQMALDQLGQISKPDQLQPQVNPGPTGALVPGQFGGVMPRRNPFMSGPQGYNGGMRAKVPY